MITVNFTEFRQNAKQYIDAVEKGDVINIKRHGKVVAQLVSPGRGKPSWSRRIKPLEISGVSLSETVLEERKRSR